MDKIANITLFSFIGLISFIIIFSIFFATSQQTTIEEEIFVPSVQNNQEIIYYDYKFSNTSGVIILTKREASCFWKPDDIDDGWKNCESIFEIENQKGDKPIISFPFINFSFAKNNVRNHSIYFSNTYTIINETYNNFSKTYFGDVIEEVIQLKKRQFVNFTSLPNYLDTSKPFAIKLTFEVPKYEENIFNFTISGEEFIGFIDPDINSCSFLGVPNTVYTLVINVSSLGTCFTILANNITLNGNGYHINYSVAGTSNRYGIYIKGANQTTIKNFRKIFEENSNGIHKYGIYFDKAHEGIVNNVTIETIGISSDGIRINNGNDTKINNTKVITLGDSAVGIYLYGSSSSIINNNNITTNKTSARGIELGARSNFNKLSNNIITTEGNESTGILLDSSSINIINNNIIRTFNNNAEGINFADAQNNTINYSIVTTLSNNASGIFIGGSSDGNLIYNSFFNSSLANDILFFWTSAGTLNLTNVTLANNNVNFNPLSTSRLNVHWYFDAQVNDSSKNPLENVNVSAWDINNVLRFSDLTNNIGRIKQQALLEYVQNNTQKIYHTNYTINATKDGFTESKSVNLTANTFMTFILPTTIILTSDNIVEDGDINYEISSGLYKRDKTSITIEIGNAYYYISRSYIEFNTSSIPDSAIIKNVSLNISFDTLGTRNCTINEVSEQPSIISNQTLYIDIGNGTTYINNDDFCRTGSSTKSKVDLGASANIDLENLLSSNWFGIGIKWDNEITAATTALTNASESSSSPLLTVSYI